MKLKGATLVTLLLIIAGYVYAHSEKEDNARPWHAYAWSKRGNRAQWWFTSFETYRDCVEATRHEVSTGPNGAWYSEPFGCGYYGNNYWRVRLMNWWYDAKSNDFECIARSSDAESAKSGMTYSPVLKGYEPPRGTVYCVD
jgi:hypothetical protein